MKETLNAIFAGVFVGLFIVTGVVGAIVYMDGRSGKTESKYTESAHEARVFSRECYDRPNSVLDPHQYTFGAWYLTCEWTEK